VRLPVRIRVSGSDPDGVALLFGARLRITKVKKKRREYARCGLASKFTAKRLIFRVARGTDSALRILREMKSGKVALH